MKLSRSLAVSLRGKRVMSLGERLERRQGWELNQEEQALG